MKTVFITGASSGFGKLAVDELLSSGNLVIASVRGGRTRAEGLFSAHPQLHFVDLDLLRPEQVQSSAQEVLRLCNGRLDVLINNAGYGLFGMLEDVSTQELREQFDVNFFSPIELTRLLTPALIAARGRVINVTSIVGLITLPMYSAYCASKFAFDSATESLYYELKPFGVQVAAVEPGGFKTRFVSGSKKVAVRATTPDSRHFFRTRRFLDLLESRSVGLSDPRSVARLIARLCDQPKIGLRYPIGADARLVIVLRKILPDGLRVRLLEWIFRRLVVGRLPDQAASRPQIQ